MEELEWYDKLIYVIICSLLILIMATPLVHAQSSWGGGEGSPAFSSLLTSRNWYMDELVITRASYVYPAQGKLYTSWGELLAENVTFIISEGFQNDPWHNTNYTSRLSYIYINHHAYYLPPAYASNYSKKDGIAFAGRIMSYINTRQMNMACYTKEDELHFYYPQSSFVAYPLIQNMHALYPYLRVMNQSYGFSFGRP
jgi:hypothetical protein